MNRTWSDEQTRVLIKQYGKMPVVALSPLLNKSPNAIRIKANKMGLKSGLQHRVTIPLDEIINFRKMGYSSRQIGRLIGYSYQGVLNAERRLLK